MEANTTNSATPTRSPKKETRRQRYGSHLRSYVGLVRDATRAWSVHRASTMGAALAFYATFSIAPVLVIAIAVAGAVFGAEAARGEVVTQISGITGEGAAETIQSLLEQAYHADLGFWASAIAVVTLLIAATSVFAELKDSLDIIWDAKPPERSGVMTLLRGRLLSFGLILTVGFLLLLSLVLSAGLAALTKYWGGWFERTAWLLELINSLFSFAVVSALFAAIYKWLPDPWIAWRDVAVGAMATAALFTLGKFLIGFYLGHSDIASGFGAAGSLILILLWVYYSSQIFFFGAEFTRAYAEYRGSRSGLAPAASQGGEV